MISGAGAGWQAIGGSELSLQFEAGRTFVSEDFDVGGDDRRLSARLASKGSAKIAGTVSISEQISFYPSLEGDQYQVRNEARIANALVGGWSLSLSNVIDYHSDPPMGVDKLDVLWLFGLQFSFEWPSGSWAGRLGGLPGRRFPLAPISVKAQHASPLVFLSLYVDIFTHTWRGFLRLPLSGRTHLPSDGIRSSSRG